MIGGMYVATFLVACLSTGLRGFQNKAVAANNKKVAFANGMVMNTCDLLVVASLVANMNQWTIMVSAWGAGLGWLIGMTVHDHVNRKHRERLAKERKETLKRTVDKRVEKRLDKMFSDVDEALRSETNGDPRVPVHMPDGNVIFMRESLYNAIKAKAAEDLANKARFAKEETCTT